MGAPKLLSCQSGFTLSGDKCVQSASAYCPTGELNSSKTVCEQYTTDVFAACSASDGMAIMDVAEGYWRCSLTGELANVYCSDGSAAKGRCPDGTTQPTYSCSAGLTLDGSQCSRSAIESCPSGYSLVDSSCQKKLTESVTYACSSGYARSGASCTRTLTQPVNYTCQSGYSLYKRLLLKFTK